MKRIWTGLVLILALSAPALAADIATRYKAPPPPPPPPPSWAGFYLGINGGGGIVNGDIADPNCFECASTVIHAGFGTVGGQIGYNWQINSFVYGVEGDINWASADRHVDYAFDNGSDAGTATLKMDGIATLRTRAGLAFDRTLAYVTGGVAWGHFDSSVVIGNQAVPPVVRGTASDHDWRFGVAAGAGIEYMITNNWTVRSEFLFLDFLDHQQNMVFSGPASAETCSFGRSCPWSFGDTAIVTRFALNYKF